MSNEKIIPFMRYRHIAMAFSALLIVASLVSLATRGLNFGLDFTGGTLIEVIYQQPANIEQVRQQLIGAGFEGAIVQHFGAETDVMIRMQRADSNKLAEEILTILRSEGIAVDLRRIEFVGPQVGDELKEQGGLAMLISLAAIMLYVAMRFQVKFSVAAVLGLIHVGIITLGFFSWFYWDFDLTVLAALLAMIGYSLNDTIIISDRIRENFRILRKGEATEIINISLTQTLGRTVITALTTLLVLFVLLFFGGDVIYGFALMLIIGVIIGTYSSTFFCTNLLLMLDVSKEDLIVRDKESETYDTP